jgi:polyhydroxybutyrate depolymerase
MKKTLLALIVILSFSANGQISSSMIHEGNNRTFHYYTPSTWNSSQELPLLIVLHGLTQSGAGIMSITDFNTIAEANNFIVCYPDGINNAWNANMNITVTTANDIGFLEELCTLFQDSLNTSPLKQYLTGFSNGGFMCHKMLCESSQCFAAIASVSGNMSDTVYTNCAPSHSSAILHIHGDADPVVSYTGSPSTGVSVNSTIEFWRDYLDCNISPTITNMPNPNIFDFSFPVKYVYNSCNNSSLELVKINGGGHQWPGIATAIGGLGNINMDFYSPQYIWDFLNGKTCSLTTEVHEIHVIKTKKLLRVIDIMGKETKIKPNTLQLLIFDDGSVEKVFQVEH